jgi:sarcosine oxidase
VPDRRRRDLLVVGVGAVGSAALRAAAEAGADVLGLERYAPAHGRGSSHGHSRIFRHAYFEHPGYVPLLRHSTARFESLERDAGVALLNRCGVLLLGGPDSEVVRGSLESARRWSLPVEALEAAALRSRFPWFRIAPDGVGAFEENAGIVRPEAAIAAMLRVAQLRGAELRTGCAVLGIVEDDGGVTVHTSHGEERARAVIVAAGAWTAGLLPELAAMLSVTRQVQAWMAPSPGVDAARMPCWLVDRGPALRPVYGLAPDPGGVAAGGDQPPAAFPKIGLHGSDIVVDPEAGAAPVGAADLEALRGACLEVAPALAGPVMHASTCLYTMSPDGHFLVGTRRGHRRTHYAAGLSGHGFKLAPALGDALVERALHGRATLPVGFLSPERF